MGLHRRRLCGPLRDDAGRGHRCRPRGGGGQRHRRPACRPAAGGRASGRRGDHPLADLRRYRQCGGLLRRHSPFHRYRGAHPGPRSGPVGRVSGRDRAARRPLHRQSPDRAADPRRGLHAHLRPSGGSRSAGGGVRPFRPGLGGRCGRKPGQHVQRPPHRQSRAAGLAVVQRQQDRHHRRRRRHPHQRSRTGAAGQASDHHRQGGAPLPVQSRHGGL